MSASKFGALIDYWSVSFPADDDGCIGGCSPEQFLNFLLHTLLDNGITELSFTRRESGLFNYQLSGNLRRSAFDTQKQTLQAGLFAYTPLEQIEKEDNVFNAGFYLSLSGAGCRGVNFPVVHHIIKAFNPRLTRLDVAIDYYEGELSFEQVTQFYNFGYFNSGGRSPRYYTMEPRTSTMEGLVKSGGFTIYVGKRGGAKCCRAYEKNYQLGDTGQEQANSEFNDWFRIEFELRANGYEIPFDAVHRLDDLLLGLYPNLIEHLPQPFHVTGEGHSINPLKLNWNSPEAVVAIEHLVYFCKQSYGGLINVFEKKGLTPTEIVNMLRPDDPQKLPKRCLLPDTFLQAETS